MCGGASDRGPLWLVLRDSATLGSGADRHDLRSNHAIGDAQKRFIRWLHFHMNERNDVVMNLVPRCRTADVELGAQSIQDGVVRD